MTTTITEFFIALVEGYDDPIELVGPFESYDEAVLNHFNRAIESGAVEPEFCYPENAHNYYLYDDAVRIARLDREVTVVEDASSIEADPMSAQRKGF